LHENSRHLPQVGDQRRHVRGDDGQAIAELVIVAPVLLLVIVLMVALGRIDSAQGDVESAARAGVQAAVVQANAAEAQTEAASSAISTLAGAGLACPSPQISTDTSNFVAGGTVSVTVTCVTSLADVSVPGVPGSKTLTATATAPIDEFRTIGGGA
jgi:Flp pilus assembly protein TadG